MEGFQQTKTFKKKYKNFHTILDFYLIRNCFREIFASLILRKFYIFSLNRLKLNFRENGFSFSLKTLLLPHACFGCYCVYPGTVVYVACVSWYFLALCNLLNLIFANTSLYVITNKYKEI